MIGSTWGKWDLHIHSPLTNINNNYKNDEMVSFVDCVKKKGIRLLGITNYWFFSENELEIVRDAFNKADCEITILGNVEFRIAQPNKAGEWINIHAVFSEKIPTKKINDVLSKIKLQNTTDDSKPIWCSRESILSSGIKFHDAYIDYDSLCNHLKENFTLGRDFFIAICPNGYGGFQPDRNEGRSVAVAKEIDKLGNIVLGRARDRDFFLLEGRFENAPQKPVFVCSDAHTEDDIGEKYTWVKAKPNFQGLRQTIFEPAERVQQHDDFIENNFIKSFFWKIEVSGKIFVDQSLSFQEQSIPLNKNMVAIIGGRGTGKSLFLDALRSRLNPNNSLDSNRKLNVENLSVYLNKGYGDESIVVFNSSNDTPYEYLHVSQGDINNFTQNPQKLSDEIKRMLGIRTHAFDNVSTQEILDNLSKYRDFVDYWSLKDEFGNNINSDFFQINIIDENQKLIETLTNPKNKELIDLYQKNINQYNQSNIVLEKTKELISLIDRSLNHLNDKITDYNNYDILKNKALLINKDVFLPLLSDNIDNLQQIIKDISIDNERIKGLFLIQGIKQDISSLLTKITDYQLNIDTAKAKLAEIESKKQSYQGYVKERNDFSSKHKSYIQTLREEIDSVFGALLKRNDHWNEDQNNIVQEILSDIEISGAIYFDVKKFYQGLEGCINRGKFRASSDRTTQSRLSETFNVDSIDSFYSLINGHPMMKIENNDNAITIESFFWYGEYFNQGGRYELLHYLFSPDSIKNYLYVNAEFKYKGQPVDRLSVGQRGTFYVSLKLATDPFGSPFVFDQPEDDLDNDFIMKQLVPLFKKIKKYRQVIIVTHNANLVINSDAEQVIVASNDGEVISYDMGAIEDGDIKQQSGIRHYICSILEGGHVAFSKRERKYGIL